MNMETAVKMARLDEDGIVTSKCVNAAVKDISRGGIGFMTDKELEIGSYYDTKICLWSREIVDAVLEIVHREQLEKGYRYGGEFIGISDTDALKIDIYQVFNDI